MYNEEFELYSFIDSLVTNLREKKKEKLLLNGLIKLD